MLHANELMIGNKLQKDNGEIFTVLRIDNTDDVLVEEQRGLLTLNYNLFGIPITEEWLLKFGFGKDLEFDNHFIDNVSLKNEIIRIATDSNYFTIELFGGEVLEIPKIKYIHQLQNLYFALTQKKLELTESGKH